MAAAAAETREGDDKEELPRPTTVDAVAKVAAIFSRRVLLIYSEIIVNRNCMVVGFVECDGEFVADRLRGFGAAQ